MYLNKLECCLSLVLSQLVYFGLFLLEKDRSQCMIYQFYMLEWLLLYSRNLFCIHIALAGRICVTMSLSQALSHARCVLEPSRGPACVALFAAQQALTPLRLVSMKAQSLKIGGTNWRRARSPLYVK